MPIYDWSCPCCGIVEDVASSIAKKTIPCPNCSCFMTRLFSPPKNIICDIEPYLDDNIGHDPIFVKSKRHKRELLKERCLVMIG